MAKTKNNRRKVVLKPKFGLKFYEGLVHPYVHVRACCFSFNDVNSNKRKFSIQGILELVSFNNFFFFFSLCFVFLIFYG